LSYKGKHIITSRVEHKAILESCEYLEKHGYEVTYLDVDKSGRVSVDDLRAAIRDDTILVSIIYVNNETGTIQDIKELAAVARERKVQFHSDAVQAVGRMPVDIRDLGVDLLSMSSHKYYGPKGIGALYARVGTRFTPFQHGGSHERGKRAGTENVAAAVGMARALELAVEEMDQRLEHVENLADKFTSGIIQRIPSARLHGDLEHWLKYTMFFTFPGSDGEAILVTLDMKGIAVSSGSACTSGATEPSHVLHAMGVPSREASTSVRFSLGKDTTESEIDYVLETLPPIIENLRQMSPEYESAR
jgi:cysteine desulfurase